MQITKFHMKITNIGKQAHLLYEGQSKSNIKIEHKYIRINPITDKGYKQIPIAKTKLVHIITNNG